MKKGVPPARLSALLRFVGALYKRASRFHRRILVAGGLACVALLLVPVLSLTRREVHAVVGPAGGADTGPRAVETPELDKVKKNVTVDEGDTLFGILSKAGVGSEDADALVGALEPVFAPGDLQPGQTIDLTLTTDPFGARSRLDAVQISVDATKEIVASILSAGEFTVRVVPLEVTYRPTLVSGVINDTLYDAAQRAGLPLSALMEMIRAYSFDVDFQRDIHPGDGFEVIYRRLYDAQGRYLRDGEMLFAALTLGGTRKAIYEYRTPQGYVDYFDPTGRSVRQMLMRTPVEGAWISSVFGWRKSPINGYSEFHRGLDFAVPVNTPIMAAGNGTVMVAGYDRDFGNYVRLRHANGYQTLYAHMVAFARGIHAGAVVSQGEVIGYVGTSGVSTGPHVHYEVIYRGERINPATVVSPSGPVLTGDELERFLETKERVDAAYASLKTTEPATAAPRDVAGNAPAAPGRRS